jgi:hypothetical protein
MGWLQGLSGLIKLEMNASALKGSYRVKGRECGIEVKINN